MSENQVSDARAATANDESTTSATTTTADDTAETKKKEKQDPIMQYVEKLEAWRQSKLDRFDSDQKYREERLMKHGTRTLFEEFLDRSIEKQCAKTFGKKKELGGFDKALSALEKMAKALKKGKMGSPSVSAPPKQEIDKDAVWSAAIARMDPETKDMWNYLEANSTHHDELRRRFMLSLQSGVR